MNKIIENKKFHHLFGDRFEFVDSGFNNGDYNMNFDFERVGLLNNNDALPIFRLYGWNPWTVSLGANQKSDDINEELCRKEGFAIIRRPTGGRAVLHAYEITYCVVLKIPDKFTVHDVYKEIHTILLEGLKQLGCDSLDFGKSQADFKNFYQNKTLSVSCFASTARYEIEYQGRKLVGSAQHNYNGVLLQHGSILIGPGHEKIADVANLKSEEDRQVLKRYILKHSATINEVADRELTYDECSQSIKSVLFN